MERRYLEAYIEALQRFSARDPSVIVSSSGTRLDPSTSEVILSYCSMEVRISHPEGRFRGPDLSDAEKVVILQYLAETRGIPPRGRWISFLELPGGDSHDALFRLEALKPLAATFGTAVDRFVEACRKLGGKPIEIGDRSMVIPVLPYLPVSVVIWTATDEFGPSASMLFDASAPFNLTMAAIYVVGIEVSQRLIELGQGMS